MDKKKKTILASIVGIVIVFLLALLIYANFIYKGDEKPSGGSEPTTPTTPVGDDNSNHAPKDFEDDTNSDASEENISVASITKVKETVEEVIEEIIEETES